jgi:very-short-patch-repair endonuclease
VKHTKPIPKEFSNNEMIVFLFFKKLGINFITQIPIEFEDKTYYPDFWISKNDYPKMKARGMDIEVDSDTFHKGTKGQIRKDEERDEAFIKHGYRVVRIEEEEFKNIEKLKKRLKNILKEEKIIK